MLAVTREFVALPVQPIYFEAPLVWRSFHWQLGPVTVKASVPRVVVADGRMPRDGRYVKSRSL